MVVVVVMVVVACLPARQVVSLPAWHRPTAWQAGCRLSLYLSLVTRP